MFNPIDWITDAVNKGVYSFFADLASDILSNAFNGITDFIINTSDINQYMNISSYLIYSKIIAAASLVAVVSWEALKQTSGGMIETEEKSVGVMMLKIVWAFLMIQFMPYSVTKVLLPLNNALIGIMQEVGVRISIERFTDYLGLTGNLNELGGLIIFMTLILGIAFILLTIAAFKRYAELVVAVVISPFAAISAVRGGEAITSWAVETSVIVFTQALHIFLLQLLLSVMGKFSGNRFMMYVVCISLIGMITSGPMVLRKYISGTGAGSKFMKSSKTAAVKTIAKAYMGG